MKGKQFYTLAAATDYIESLLNKGKPCTITRTTEHAFGVDWRVWTVKANKRVKQCQNYLKQNAEPVAPMTE